MIRLHNAHNTNTTMKIMESLSLSSIAPGLPRQTVFTTVLLCDVILCFFTFGVAPTQVMGQEQQTTQQHDEQVGHLPDLDRSPNDEEVNYGPVGDRGGRKGTGHERRTL